MDELGHAVVNLCHIVPGGVVCFLPSYDYEHRLYTHWTTTGCLEKINTKKKVAISLVSPSHVTIGISLKRTRIHVFVKVFREPKLASQVNTILTQYSRCIEVSHHTVCIVLYIVCLGNVIVVLLVYCPSSQGCMLASMSFKKAVCICYKRTTSVHVHTYITHNVCTILLTTHY